MFACYLFFDLLINLGKNFGIDCQKRGNTCTLSLGGFRVVLQQKLLIGLIRCDFLSFHTICISFVNIHFLITSAVQNRIKDSSRWGVWIEGY